MPERGDHWWACALNLPATLRERMAIEDVCDCDDEHGQRYVDGQPVDEELGARLALARRKSGDFR